MSRLSLIDGSVPFAVTLLEAVRPLRFALFSVGAGGSPERHLPLLAALAENGVTVAAPHFDRLVSPHVSEADLVMRARRLRLTMDAFAAVAAPVIGLGHSIGATMLLALAGGQAWLGPGRPISIDFEPRLDRLVLLAPATGYFQAPGALDGVRTPMLTWVGAKDIITPPSQGQMLKQALPHRVPVDLRIENQAGHFSFMHTPPPHAEETLVDRGAFLQHLTQEVVRFAVS